MVEVVRASGEAVGGLLRPRVFVSRCLGFRVLGRVLRLFTTGMVALASRW